MSDKQNQAASITPPVPGQNTIIRAGTASAERIKLPSTWSGWLKIQAEGVKLWFAIGGSSIVVNETHTTTLTSELPSAHGAGECECIFADSETQVNLAEIRKKNEADSFYLSHKEASATGYIRIIHSSGPVSVT